MIVDTSALIAILFEEPEADELIDILLDAGSSRMAAGSWIEVAAVLTRKDKGHLFAVASTVCQRFQIEIAAMTVAQAQIGHDAYLTLGLGTGHPARLNFGDCFAYALAKDSGEPLLFRGDDFIHTDVTPAIAR